MAEKLYRYPAVLVRQGPTAAPLLLFSASAIEMDRWVGIPQKERFLEGETLGFQRDSNPTRVDQIAKFYSEPKNVIHNPLLCAIRKPEGFEVSFQLNGKVRGQAGPTLSGILSIKMPDRSEQSFETLLREAREALEERVPSLKGHVDPDELVAKLRLAIDESTSAVREGDESDYGTDDEDTSVDVGVLGEEALFEASHVEDFWCQLRAREVLLQRLGTHFTGDSFLGFRRDAVEAYLRPLILVDGQHRLMGALKAARDSMDHDVALIPKITSRLRSGAAREGIEDELLIERARRLPISLLMDPAPGEHVFQFVVVNQKATPVRPALLATIISTSLSEAELEPITDRLENAGIPLKSSRAISFLTTNDKSPFANRVTRGLAPEGVDLLPWTVLGQLVTMFRDLKTARFFHDSKMDYADIWKRRFLDRSEIVTPDGSRSAFEVWSTADGPWREVFMAFWWAVRHEFGVSDNTEAYNYWGKPRSSNLFNKPSLMTLATDFFAYLVESKRGIDSAEGIGILVEEWLTDVDRSYFARDWKLAGVKKDAVGTRKQWSKLWQVYRLDPKGLPQVKAFSTLYKEA